MNYFLGIDVSTTGVKALLIDRKGNVVGSANTEQPLSSPQPLWSEQDPADWWKGTQNSIRTLLREMSLDGGQIEAVGMTGQMHGLTLLDAGGKVLRPAILWNDQRTGAQCDEIRRRLGKDRLIQLTGNDALTGFTAPKILWVQQNEPEVYARTRHILLPKDYVRWHLTGGFAVDRADGAGTILFDIQTRDWSPEVLQALGIAAECLPKTFEGPEITGLVTAEAAKLTGLRQGTPVIAGGGDNAAMAVGVGAVKPGVVALTLGTSGVIFATTGQAFIEPGGRLHAFCHSVPGRWHLMGVMLSAAGSLRWYRDTVAPGMGYDELLGPAAQVAMGSEGLLFLPYLTGERTPYPDPLARGAFVGLTVRHGLAHMTRSVLEGVAFGLRDSFELLKTAGLATIDQVRVTGGGARSALWRQILADTFNTELVTVKTTEGAAYGAAILAGVGAGAWSDVDAACEATVQLSGSTRPEPQGVAFYERAYRLYRQLYPALKEISHGLADLNERPL
jgi:xylulokinase